MATVMPELMDKITQLDEAAQRKLLAYVENLLRLELEKSPTPMTLGEWLREAQALRDEMRAKYGANHFYSVEETLDEIREERLNDIMGGR
jgi:hypothetical protein